MLSLIVYLYREVAVPSLDMVALADYLQSLIPPLAIEVRPPFAQHYLATAGMAEPEARRRLARIWAAAKVRNPTQLKTSFEPLLGEVAFEEKRLSQPESRTFGLLYDGFELMEALAQLIPPDKRSLAHLHIVFTNQLIGTFDTSNRRYHARVCTLGWPCLISTSGIVEAPAKPREYYILRQQFVALGMADAAATALEPELRGRFIEHDDERLTEVMKGYVAQTIFYHIFGEPFCEERDCRLYNAHWQHEVIRAQLGGPHEFCPRHRRMLEGLL